MNTKQYFVYITTNKNNSVLYVGITNNLPRRIFEHKNKYIKGFTEKYNVDRLIYYEVFEESYEAIKREKQLKNWHREWRLNLNKQANPELKDLYLEIA